MGFYRFEAKIISRGGGRSSVASAAYRSGGFTRRSGSARGGRSVVAAAAYRHGGKLINEQTGEVHDFSRKRGVQGTEIMLPKDAPAWMEDRGTLWNAVEKIEKRSDSQLARDFVLSLPHELAHEQRVALTREFVREQFCDRGYAADIAWHAPDKTESLNHHAHVMVPLRKIDADGFARTKERAPAGEHPAKVWKDELMRLRVAWADTANRHLEAAGLDTRIDHRSLKSRGIDQEPEPKQGPLANKIEQDGRESYAGRDRRAVRARNAERARLKIEHARALVQEAQIIDFTAHRDRGGQMPIEEPTENPESAFDAAKIYLATVEAQRDRMLKDAAEQVGPFAKQNAERLVSQAEELQREHDRAAERLRQFREFNAGNERIAEEEKRRQATREAEVREGEITDAGNRYREALGNHYDIQNPYGSLARAAMAEYGSFIRERADLNRRIAEERNPDQRKILELRRDIEHADYIAITSTRIAGQSYVITGRRDTEEGLVQRARAKQFEAEAKELRKQYREKVADQVLAEEAKKREPTESSGSPRTAGDKLAERARRAAERSNAPDRDPHREKDAGQELAKDGGKGDESESARSPMTAQEKLERRARRAEEKSKAPGQTPTIGPDIEP